MSFSFVDDSSELIQRSGNQIDLLKASSNWTFLITVVTPILATIPGLNLMVYLTVFY